MRLRASVQRLNRTVVAPANKLRFNLGFWGARRRFVSHSYLSMGTENPSAEAGWD